LAGSGESEGEFLVWGLQDWLAVSELIIDGIRFDIELIERFFDNMAVAEAVTKTDRTVLGINRDSIAEVVEGITAVGIDIADVKSIANTKNVAVFDIQGSASTADAGRTLVVRANLERKGIGINCFDGKDTFTRTRTGSEFGIEFVN
jgi:hypothetical protein